MSGETSLPGTGLHVDEKHPVSLPGSSHHSCERHNVSSSQTERSRLCCNQIEPSSTPSKVNLFVRLADIFPAERAWHKPTDEARKKLLIQTLSGKYSSLEPLVSAFYEYCFLDASVDAQIKHFLDAIFEAIAGGMWKEIIPSQLTDMFASLVLKIDDALEILLLISCKTNSPVLLDLLNASFTASSINDLNNNTDITPNANKGKQSLIEKHLLFGETPLIHAVRNKSPGVTLLLLRLGAKATTPWLRFHSAFGVLLFSPHATNVSQKQQRDIKLCLEYLCRTVISIDIEHLLELQRDDYYPLLECWEALIPDDRVRFGSRQPGGATSDSGNSEHHGKGTTASGNQTQATCIAKPNLINSNGSDTEESAVTHKRGSCPATLSHLTRCSIRSLIKEHGSFPRDIYSLPLPKLLLQYVDLRIE